MTLAPGQVLSCKNGTPHFGILAQVAQMSGRTYVKAPLTHLEGKIGGEFPAPHMLYQKNNQQLCELRKASAVSIFDVCETNEV